MTYTIIESNEKKGEIKGGTFSSLKEAVKALGVSKYMAERHGQVIKSAVKSFTWEYLDEYNTPWKATYKIVKND